MMQVGTLMEFKSFSLAPMIGSSAPLANCARQRSMAAMNVFGSIAMHEDRAVCRPRLDALLEVIERAHGGHAAVLCRLDIFAVVILGEARCGEWAAGDAPQQQRAHGVRIFQREQHR